MKMIDHNHFICHLILGTFTEYPSFIEFLDADFAYHCYPIERVPVKKFDEIVSLLRQLGIDATNSFE